MTKTSIAFALGVYLLQQQAALPDAVQLLAFAGGAAVLMPLALLRRRRGLAWLAWPALIGGLLAGFAWAGWLAQQRLGDALAAGLEGRDVTISGVVAELPQRLDNGLRFAFDGEGAPAGVPQRVSLAWYRAFRGEDEERGDAPELAAGERWRIAVRLKRPHGNVNPHGFDYEAYLLEQGVRATGYVRPAPDNRRVDELVVQPSYIVERVRQRLRDRLLAAMPGEPYAGVLVALAIGDQRAIDPSLWRVFAQTGLTHLMSISGLHVTMVAGIFYWLAGWTWRRRPSAMLRLPAQQAAALGGLAGAFGYCLLAGFAVPAQRTLYMLAAVALALWTRRHVGAATVLAFALWVVLLLDPWAVLSAGFWLSFGAVGLLLYISAGRVGRPHWLREWGRAQWAVTVGMVPALLALFQQFSLVSPLANAVAIPLVSLVVTPLALAACLLPAPLHSWALAAAHGLTSLLMLWVNWLADLPWAVWQQHAPPRWALAPAVTGIAWLMLPRGFPARWVGVFLLLPLVLVPPPWPAEGSADVVILDVGQGLAVHVQTAGHDLLYDTGPAFSPDANSGNRIIVPYLRAAGVGRLDTLVVSHQDDDHAGGAAAVIEAIPVAELLDSLPFNHELAAAPVPHRTCSAGQGWEWDGVRFELLHPAAGDYEAPPPKSNDLSCVLKITAAGGSILLPGDIEARSEARLVAARAARRKGDVLVAPHQGSRTSSSDPFVGAVGAETVVFPVGYLNRFHHPHPQVLQRYVATGARILRSDTDGAVTLQLRPEGIAVIRERERQRRYWHGR